MRVGTRSLLYGAHCIPIHTAMIAIGWRVHHGRWPREWQVWAAFLLHDIGYWGSPDMDGEVGKTHPMAGARLVARIASLRSLPEHRQIDYHHWYNFTAFHSRYYAEHLGGAPSELAIPDKLATALMPIPLLALLYRLSGEHDEYIRYARSRGHRVPGHVYGYTRWIVYHWREKFLGWKGWKHWLASRRRDRSTRKRYGGQ